MEFARQYVSALQDSRHVEKDRRETRRRLRNEYLTATLRHRDQLSRQALRRDIRMYTGMFSEMEQDLFTSIRRTSTWWNSLCEHSIDQRLQYEAAERDRRIHRAKYLGNMSEREAKELQNAVNSDGRRWLALKQESDVFERETRNAAIADAIQLILATTFDCVDALDKYSLQQSDEQSILTSFTLRNTTRQSIPTERINTNASDAFRAIFKGSPYEMSSPYFLELIHLMYRLMDDGRRVTTQFDASDVPLFVVDGPSYSGKSLLARNLAARFGMLYSSDHVLITKALSAYNREKNSFSDEVFSQAEILPALTTMEISSPRVKMHGGDVLTSGVLFANETNEEDKPGTMHLPSMWAILGKKIHAALVSGMAVEAALIGDLLRLELMDVQFGTDRRSGIIFDGVLVSLSLLQQLHRDLLPDLSHPFLDVGLLWCPSLVGAPLVDLAKAAEDEQRELEAMEAARRAEEERELEGGEPLVALEAPTSAGPAAATATPPAAETPPTCCNQLVDIPPMWRITKSSLEDVPNKKEVKTKSTKRNNDAALLPPPDLPPVDAVMEDVVRERRFIARSQEELAAYHNVFAAALRIDCSPQEIFKRFAGLRMDRETGEEYHLIYDPPPRQRMPFLVNFDRTLAFTAQLHDMVFRQHTEWESLLRWFDSRPTERPQIRYIAGEATVEEMSNEAADVLNDSLQKFSVGKELHLASNAAINNVRLLMNKYRTQVAAREAERARLITLYTEKGVAPPPELEQSLNPNACCEIPDDLPDVVLRCVSSFSTNYASTFDRAWESCSDLTRLLLDYRMSAEGMLRHFWDRPDNKQELVDVFRKKFNHIPAHLRSKSVCKEELHYYVDELNDSLAASVESRKKDCLALIDHITRREAYLEGWEGNLANLGASMGCAEIERFLLVANMTLLYFSAVVGEPTMFEELDTGITPVKSTLESATVETSAAGKSKDAKDRRMQSAKKSHNKSTDDSADKSYMEEVINDTMQRLIASITAFTDKFKAVVDANIRGMKKNVMVNSVKVAVVAAKCLPVLESELGAAVERICAIKEFVLDVLHQAEAYVQQGKSKMLNEARAMLRAQASAVNSVVYSLRSCIEEEREAPHMHIGCGTFAVEEGRQGKRRSLPSEQSFLTDVPLYGRLTAAGVRIHSSLSATRLLDLIRIFRCLAPRYQLPRDDFMLVMRREDYTGALDEDDVEATLRVKEPSELFSSFDMDHTGVIDWREVIVHLLFWCNPPPKRDRTEESFYIPEVSIQQLTTTRDAAGLGLVTKEAFFNSPFFFDAIVDGDRLLAYTTALWETFCERDGCSIDMTSVLWFLCADPQPIRGAQKAFYVLSKGESRDGALTVEEMDCIFHIKATNARRVGLIDPFSKPNLQLLFGEASTITFAQVCASVIGRQMLNRVAVFRRKTFTTDL